MSRSHMLVAAAVMALISTGWLLAREEPAATKPDATKTKATEAKSAETKSGEKKAAENKTNTKPADTKPAAAKPDSAKPTAKTAEKDSGDDEPAPPARPDDEKAIRASSDAFVKAFESGDAAAVAALFTENAEYIDDQGDPIRGRPALARAYGKFFENRKDVDVESKIDAVRFLGAETAIEEGVFTVKPKEGLPTASRFSALRVRENGKWLIAMLKEWDEEVISRPELQDLAWLIGSWQSEGDEVVAKTTYEWTANKSFIRMNYSIKSKKDGEGEHSGVQVIGVDPAVGLIRAWQFGSDGAIGESNWTWDGDRWVIESIATLANGSRTTAVNFLSRKDKDNDAFTWRSVQRHLDDEPQPDIGPVTVKRLPEAEKDKVKPKAKGTFEKE